MKALQKFNIAAVLLVSSGLALAQCGSTMTKETSSSSSSKMMTTYASGQTCSVGGQTIVETAVGAGDFNTLVAAVKAADLVDPLQNGGPFTVFAPTDAAFASLPAGTLTSLLKPENKAQLQSILTYHVVPGKVYSSDLIKTASAQTLIGKNVKLSLLVNNAKLVKTDIKCSNGVIHVIDAVIMPPEQHPQMYKDSPVLEVAAKAGKFNTLLTAIHAAGLKDALNGEGPFTVFAPTDEAFAALPAGTLDKLLSPGGKKTLQSILKYHVVSGEIAAENAERLSQIQTLQGSDVAFSRKGSNLFVDNARIVVKNLYAKNGVIHVIDAVITPTPAAAYNDIITTANKAGNFNTLITAVKAADLDGAINNGKSLTVFAPTDEAFAAIPDSTLKYLLSPEGKPKLQSILKYHVVPGNVYSMDIIKTRSSRTLQGSPVYFSLMVDDANVEFKDIKCSNGVIHVIDKVIMPPSDVAVK